MYWKQTEREKKPSRSFLSRRERRAKKNETWEFGKTEDQNQNSNRFKPIKIWSHNVEYMHRESNLFLLLALLIGGRHKRVERPATECWFSTRKFKHKIQILRRASSYQHRNSCQHIDKHTCVFILHATFRNNSSTRKTTFLIKPNKYDRKTHTNNNNSSSKRQAVTTFYRRNPRRI